MPNNKKYSVTFTDRWLSEPRFTGWLQKVDNIHSDVLTAVRHLTLEIWVKVP